MKNILVANRGEIALRVICAIQALGHKAIAIYALDDQNLPFVQRADLALCLGEGNISNTYLNTDKIIELALKNKVNAIHPGYGLLSERSHFCKKVEEAGITFIGPTADSIALMGSKESSKVFAQKLGVPLVPGYFGSDQSLENFYQQALKLKAPFLIKATYGGGGKGMRKIEKMPDSKDEFKFLLEGAQREALNAFGDGQVMLEQFVASSRHIEVQILGDGKGGALSFGIRECSIQRRYQKVLEEAGCGIKIQSQSIEKLLDYSEKLTSGLKYRSLGTIEFMIDDDENIYFLEMNTRLQVEHPVTELCFGIDLVQTQIQLALNQISFAQLPQKRVNPSGHAIEVRLNAERPEMNFLPSSGTIQTLDFPYMPFIRCDLGYQLGDVVSGRYDSLLGKIISWGKTRDEAIARLKHYLKNIVLLGISSNRNLLLKILDDSSFQKGVYNTRFLDNFFKQDEPFLDAELLGLLVCIGQDESLFHLSSLSFQMKDQPLVHHLKWNQENTVELAGVQYTIDQFTWKRSSKRWVKLQDGTYQISLSNKELFLKILTPKECLLQQLMQQGYLKGDGQKSSLSSEKNLVLKAPMHGKLISLLVKPGDNIKAGQVVAVMEAMKMEHSLASSIDGVVEKIIDCPIGSQLAEGETIALIIKA